MVAPRSACARLPARAWPLRHFLAVLGVGLMLAAVWLGNRPGEAQEAARPDGLVITVPNPIDDAVVEQIERQVKDATQRQGRNIRTIIFDFNPNDQPAGTTRFERCLGLAELIRKLSGRDNINTVAFVHNEVTSHTVLPAMMCRELVMSPTGKIGEVMRGAKDDKLSDPAKSAYELAARQKGALAIFLYKMIDERLVVVKKTTGNNVEYLDKVKADEERKAWEAQGKTYPQVEPVAGLEAARVNTLFDAEKARALGLCKAVYRTRAEVAGAYGLPPRALREDALLGRTPVAWRIDLRSPLNKARLSSLERRVRAAVGKKANLIILNLECDGGDTTEVASVAQFLRNLKDDNDALPVKTIAYVPPNTSLGAATFLALGCSEIVMSSTAVLGDFGYLKGEKESTLLQARRMLKDLARDLNYPAALFEATLTPDVKLVKVRNRLDPANVQVMSAEDVTKEWEVQGTIAAPKGEFLKIDAKLAKDWNLATYTDVEDVQDLYNRYDLDASKVRVSRDDWLDKVAEFFREPIVNVILIMIGIAGLILELKMPGTGVPGVIAAICFVLFFWAHSFVGQFTTLAIFLFVLGLVLLGMEIFVFPGLGVLGISGIILVVASLVLVTLERMPETTSEWISLGTTLTTFGVGLVAAIVGAFVLAWYLPSIPIANRLVLKPPSETDEAAQADAAGGTEHAALLGAIGVAATTLRPSGKARIGDEYLDVIAEGDFINPGTRVQVIEIEGNRIVVKEV